MDASTAPGNRGGRIATWVREMWPPLLLVPSGLAHFFAIHWSLQAIARQRPLTVTWRAGCGAATVVLFSLLMRIYDELKDAEGDLALGRAGDPLYKDRPIVKGEITVGDLVFLRWIVTGLLVAANAPLGWPLPLAAFAAVFVLMWASFHWFFVPAISKNLLLAFATHNPISLAIAAYAASVYAADFGRGSLTPLTWLLLFGMWFPIAAWETSRKVRLPEEETAYQTYSKILGLESAATLPLIFVVMSAACLTPILRPAGLGGLHIGLLHGSAGLAAFACIRLLVAPKPGRADLRRYVEPFVVVVNVGLAVALWLRHGVVAG